MNSDRDSSQPDPRSDPPQTDDDGTPIDDGMGPDAPADVAGEDAPVDSDAPDPLDEATST